MTASVATIRGLPEARTELVELSVADPRWLDFVLGRDDAGPFHHPSWATLLAECYDFRALALGLIESDRITGGLPVIEVSNRTTQGRRWISLPFTDYCPPLGDGPGYLEEALASMSTRAGVSRLEVRAPFQQPRVHRTIAGYRHTVALAEDPELVFQTFKKSRVQRGIRQGENHIAEGRLSVRRAETEDDLASAFYFLHVATRSRLGVPVQPRRFFRLLWRRMLEPGHGFALLAYSNGRAVAGAVFLVGGTTTIYKFGASEPHAQRLRPNHVLLWEAIKIACESGHRLFDFGRTDCDGESLREFKLGWGTVEDLLVYSALGGADPRPRDGRAEKALGAVIRRSPDWFCRASGELLYRRSV